MGHDAPGHVAQIALLGQLGHGRIDLRFHQLAQGGIRSSQGGGQGCQRDHEAGEGLSKAHGAAKVARIGACVRWRGVDEVNGAQWQVLAAQVAAGASAVQLFDSWVGSLSERDYREYVLPHSRTALGYVPDGVPRIHFGVGTGELLGAMSEAGVDVMGVDFRVPLPVAAGRVGPEFALQGNLDPAALFAGPAAVERRVEQVLADAQGLPGHVFNLGHGVLPTTDPEVLTAVVEQVHTATARPSAGTAG